MSSPEPRLKPNQEIQLCDAAGVAQLARPEPKQGPSIADPSPAESLLTAEKRTLEMMANGASLSEVLNDLCASIDAHAPPVASMVCLMDPDGKELVPGAGPHIPAALRAAITPWPIGPNRGSCGTAAFTKQRVIIPDISDDPRWPDGARDLALNHGFCAAWSEPLISKDGEVLGTFCFSYAEPRIPNSRDLELIQAAGHIALIAIELERSHRALKSALVKIKNSENKLRTIIDTIPGFVCTLSAAGEVELVNRQVLEYFGKTMGELKNWATSNVIHPDDLPRVVDSWKRSIEIGRPYDLELRQRRADGVYRWFQSRALPARDAEGRIAGWYMLLTDIDDRKRAEEELYRSKAYLTEAQRLSRTGSFGCRLSTGEMFWSEETFRIYGYDRSTQPAVVRVLDRVHPEDRALVQERMDQANRDEKDCRVECRLLLPDGSVKHVCIVAHASKNESGTTEFIGAVMDVTAQRQASAELEKAFEEIKRLKDRLHDENVVLREQIDQAFMFEEIVGSSPALKTVLSSIVKVAPTDSTVLITGETGTGKEVIARAIHKGSQRAGQAFISVNCASIPSSLIASELFGHEKGAFTGALQRRQGRFELANSGTIFLDEIGELPHETQIALLRVLQERQFERVGGNRVLSTDVRVIAATNRDLSAAIATGAFRADLFYRLNVFPIHVPPLRNRKEDIPMLVEYFVKRYAEKAGKQISKIDKNTLKLCQSYHWPGNIRELQNIVERSVILCTGDAFWIDEAWLSSQKAPHTKSSAPLTKTLKSYEKELIEAALAESTGKVAGPNGAAAKLGIPRSTLDLKIKQLSIKKHITR